MRVDRQFTDFDMDDADCSDADQPRTGSGLSEIVMRVVEVIDDTGGRCDPVGSVDPLAFDHEPDGVTYCLVSARIG